MLSTHVRVSSGCSPGCELSSPSLKLIGKMCLVGSPLASQSGNDEEYEVEGIRDSTVFAKESEASRLPEICLSGAASASTLSPLLRIIDD